MPKHVTSRALESNILVEDKSAAKPRVNASASCDQICEEQYNLVYVM